MRVATDFSVMQLDEFDAGAAAPLIREWLPRARWFGSKDVSIKNSEIYDIAVLRRSDPTTLLLLWMVEYQNGDQELYSIPVGFRRGPHPVSEYGPEHLIGTLNPGSDPIYVYDALSEPETARLIWDILLNEQTVPVRHGSFVAHLDRPLSDGDQSDVRLIATEQTNSAMVRNNHEFLKWMRRIEDGPSIELEMSGVLNERHFPHVPMRYGHLLYYQEGERHPKLQALLQQYLPNGSEGWALAMTSLRDLYGDLEETSTETQRQRRELVENQGGSFVAEAARLGEVTAELHLVTADETLGGELTPQRVDQQKLRQWAAGMISDFDKLAADPRAVVLPLGDLRDTLVAAFEKLADMQDGGMAIRIHGDYHLGQVLRTDDGWNILDFEGEPSRSVAARRGLYSPLRDVAGMLRSFDYAAAAALAERMDPADPDWNRFAVQGDAWAAMNREAFWNSYLQIVGDRPLLPRGDDLLTMRRAFELQKAIYEIGYEIDHRPRWVGIPLRFLLKGNGN